MRFGFIKDFIWHRKIRNKFLGEEQTPALKNFMKCLHVAGPDGVTIIKKGERVAYSGLHYCKNGWCCPFCGPYKMSKVRKNLIGAFHMMKEQGYKCCMVTYTIPHRRASYNEYTVSYRNIIPLATMMYVLKKAHERFWRYSRLHKFSKLAGGSFYITELTYNERNGWHPHYHALYWLKPEDWKNFTDSEEILNKIWLTVLEKTYEEITWDISAQKALKAFVHNGEEKGFKAFYFSKNKNGTPRETTTSNYFWSAEDETTGTFHKKGHNGSINQWQMLENIVNDEDPDGKYLKLFREVLEMSRGRQLWNWRPGFLKRIEEYLAAHPEPVVSKKDNTKERGDTAKIICWLSQKQWNLLKLREHCFNLNVIFASFAIQDNAFELIKEFCETFNVGPPLKMPPYTIKAEEEISA